MKKKFSNNEPFAGFNPLMQEQRAVGVIDIDPKKIIDENGNKVDLKNTNVLTKWL